MERDWAVELEGYLQNRLIERCEASGQPVPLSGLRINPALGLEESRYFLLGVEAGLFQVDELGYVQSELLPPPSQGKSRQETCQLFWHDPLRLVRECVCQLSTASFLILKRGWLKSHLLLEPDCHDDKGNSYGVDILIQSPAGQILVGVEVKRSAAELQKLATDLRACCKRGPHDKDDCGFPQNHPKYEFCAFYKPIYFWAVAPEADVCFRIIYDDGSIALEQMMSLPPRSMLE